MSTNLLTNASEILVSSLPNPLPSNGLFTVASNIPTGTFNDPSANAPNYSSTYSNWIINPADLIGTTSAPYAPVALPAYISSLYQNVYNINNSLQSNIAAASINDRHFPTSYAVQEYVQSQLSGSEVLNSSTNTQYFVSTSLSNTVISQVSSYAIRYSYVSGSVNCEVAVYEMDISANATRVGTSKTVMYADSEFMTTPGNLSFLYAGDNCSFIVAGQQQSFYQFSYRGDFVQFICIYENGTWSWLVTNYQSVFSPYMNVPGITVINGSAPLTPTPPTK